ncbi:MAG TPA: hypothetical protein VJC21_04910 [Candidatus Nanoarchaeia archaeon]|nr:hypothetical protein [Candidatus Nanoarchaeia archaeon]
MEQNSKNGYLAPSEDYVALRALYNELGSRYVRNRVDFPNAFLDVGGRLVSGNITPETLDSLLDLLISAEKELGTKIENHDARQYDDPLWDDDPRHESCKL